MMRAPRLAKARQRGVAVVTALLLTTLAITVVASLFWQQQVQVRSIENQRLQLQKEWILRGALDWARLILREDAKYSSIDALDEPWAVPLSETRLDQYVENGRPGDEADATLSGGIEDAQARFNLTNLAPNGSIVPENVQAFARLLSSLQLDPGLAAKTADFIRNTTPVTTGQQQQQAEGAQGRNQSSPALPMTQVDDLLAVAELSQDDLERLRRFVVVLPRSTAVNINTASAEVLGAVAEGLSQGDAALLVNSRQSAHFRSIADVNSRVPGLAAKVPANVFSVSTNFFFVNGQVRMSRAGLGVQALIERNGTKTNVIWVREY